jgi:hypothetical protein
MNLTNKVQAPSSKRSWFHDRVQHTCRRILYITKPLACHTSSEILAAVAHHCRPKQPYSPKHPLHFVSRLMRATHPLVHLPHRNFGMFIVPTLEQQYISCSSVQVPIDNGTFQCLAAQLPVSNITRVHYALLDTLPPVFSFSYQVSFLHD